jgi:hypothetical protein
MDVNNNTRMTFYTRPERYSRNVIKNRIVGRGVSYAVRVEGDDCTFWKINDKLDLSSEKEPHKDTTVTDKQ